MQKTFNYKSKKYTIVCAAWALLLIVVLLGTFKGFPEKQASMAWGYLVTYTTALLTLTGWWFKKDVDEKKINK